LPRDIEEDLPPAEAVALVFVFKPPEVSPVNITGYACTPGQERRISEFADGGPNREVVGDTPEPVGVTRKWVAALEPGTSLETVLARAATQSLVHQSTCDGVSLVYSVRSHPEEVVLTFDRRHRLVRKTLRSRE